MSGVGHGFGVGVHHGRVTASWTPADLDGIYLWADLDLSTVLTDANGIYSWSDLSGNDNHLVQADDTKKPDLGSAEGIQRTVEDGVNDGFDIDTGAKTFTGAFTVGMLKYTTKNSGIFLYTPHGLRDVGSGAANIITASGNLTFSDTNTFVQNEWHVNVLRRDSSDNLTARKNGVDTTAGSPNLGGDMTIANVMRETTTSDFGLNIMVIVDGFVDGDDLALLEAYLMDKVTPDAISDISSLYAWYQPEDLPTSGAVTTWPNSVTPGTFDLVSDLATDPVVGTGTNGVRSVLFSQVTTEALSTAESTNFTQPLEYIVVCMKDSGLSTVSLIDSNAGTNRIAMYDPSGDNNCYIYAGAQQATNLIPLDDQWKIWDCLVDGADTRYWLQDTEGTVGNPGAGSQDGLRIGLTGIETGPWDGEICEVLFSDGGFTGFERTFIIDYLKAKYAIA